jgi:hypothetical protein
MFKFLKKKYMYVYVYMLLVLLCSVKEHSICLFFLCFIEKLNLMTKSMSEKLKKRAVATALSGSVGGLSLPVIGATTSYAIGAGYIVGGTRTIAAGVAATPFLPLLVLSGIGFLYGFCRSSICGTKSLISLRRCTKRKY